MLQESMLITIILVLFMITVVSLIRWQDARNKLLYVQGKFHPFQRKKQFLTGNEQRLFRMLNSLDVLQNYFIFPQLHLSTLLQVKDDAKDMIGKFEYINKLFVDFVIFDQNLNPVVVIELNDSTHFWNPRKARDQFVSEALKSIGIPLVILTSRDLTFKASALEKLAPYLLMNTSANTSAT